MEMKPVESSTIHSIGYDPDGKVLSVQFQFKDGSPSSLYHYANVDLVTYQALSQAPSVGSFLQTVIKREPARWPATLIVQETIGEIPMPPDGFLGEQIGPSDTDRLDWLDKQVRAHGMEVHESNSWTIEGAYGTLRAAIDAEMAAES